MNDTAEDLAAGLAEQAELIQVRVGAWCDFGYANPPAPDCAPIPPLGERSANAITNGHQAIRDIDRLIAQLRALRGQLEREMRQDSDIRGVRIDAQIAAWKAGQP